MERNAFAASSFFPPYWVGIYVVAILCYLNTVKSNFILSETFRRWTRQILCVNTVITLYKAYIFFTPKECYKRRDVSNISQDHVLFCVWGCNKWPHFLPLRSLFYYRHTGTKSFDSPKKTSQTILFSPQNRAVIYRVIQSVCCTECFIFYVILRRCITCRLRIAQVMRTNCVIYLLTHISSVN